MPDGNIVAHIGCPTCGTCLFDLRAVPAAGAGVFENQMERREGTAEDASTEVCGTCEGLLARVAAP